MITTLEEFKVLGDHRGQLVALEANRQIPFDVKRVFYIYGTQEGVPRGNHSHYKTKQFLVAVNGSCKVTLDNGKEKETFDLNKPNLGLFQDALIWGTMHDFSSDCVLMVLADEYYDASDYITKYDKFLEVK
ncbi:sugar 3,4-ketoisomerase [Aliarcobacter butzleri]|uniref:sugar 3,4-ketoisomerase n=1 Tax=Aliarcobacter butzleri TaxID=28197 RepID=UPI0021B25B6F|nr:FdtA/QdtA family cupin domain-containing protein [Aliarcobacter butzleri]MCT7557142.1 FdtA/QdtA family cupin domain-containing protein [Aliarcobacter butzleri]MCT7622140.1 FdtA/QdtA family cupin domain-containing protein [Aliarcobacter butzleri]MCT7633543.1 FdtA/QdtA family cupin domain-containing protein [Aliarcobacter butzleri]